MADLLTHLKQRSGDDWLIGYNSQKFLALAERVLGELRSRPQPERPLTILLAERDPLPFLAHFIAACAANCCIVLANPDWAPAEWQQVLELVQPDLVWGKEVEGRRQEAGGRSQTSNEDTHSPLPTPHSPLPTSHILIPTGGTSGNSRFAIHTWETLMASVEGFCQYFEVQQVNSFCVLPLYHVSGLMQFLRSFTTGGKLVVQSFKAVERGDRGSINPEDFFLSLVPTQLQRLLDGEVRSQQSGASSQQSGGNVVDFISKAGVNDVRSQESESTQHLELNTPHSSPAPHTPHVDRLAFSLPHRSSRRRTSLVRFIRTGKTSPHSTRAHLRHDRNRLPNCDPQTRRLSQRTR